MKIQCVILEFGIYFTDNLRNSIGSDSHMSIQNIQSNIQNTELYQIHKNSEAHNAEHLQEQQTASVQEVIQADEYDTANPVGEEVEGIYSVSYDDEGNLQVNYTQPGGNANAKSEGAASAGGTATASGTEESAESSDDVEEEIEKLKRQRDQIKQQLNKEKGEDVKKSLRAQLQAIEAQIAMLSSQLKS